MIHWQTSGLPTVSSAISMPNQQRGRTMQFRSPARLQNVRACDTAQEPVGFGSVRSLAMEDCYSLNTRNHDDSRATHGRAARYQSAILWSFRSESV